MPGAEWIDEVVERRVRVVDLQQEAVPEPDGAVSLIIGVARSGLPAGVPEPVDVLLTEAEDGDPDAVRVADVDASVDALLTAVRRSPRAALALPALLRQTERLPVPLGLAAESAVYSALLAGPEFARWRASRPIRPVPPADDAVLLSRAGDVLTVTLNRPERRNAFGTAVRDQLNAALELALIDDSIREVRLHGSGPDFCSGGDLDEFGSAPDVATAHLVRLEASAGSRIHALTDRVTVQVQGACIGAGVELPAFAGRVIAAHDAFFALPELAMGLVPGAGGTVSITRRIGRRRTAYLALSGTRVSAADALTWGLVDALA